MKNKIIKNIKNKNYNNTINSSSHSGYLHKIIKNLFK